MKKKILSRLDILVYALVAIFYFWLVTQIPYTHDDWDWGLDIGLQQLFTANLNARYAGNFFEVIMTRSELLRILIVGSGYFLLPMALSVAAWIHCKAKGPVIRLLFFAVANIFILSMPRVMWQLTYGWTAGYANFCISTIFMVALVGKILAIFREDRDSLKPTKASYFDLFAMALIGQLFLENISIFMAGLCLFALIAAWIKEKKLPWTYLLMAAGAALGLYIVFQSDIYQQLWETGKAVDGYRKMSLNSLAGLDETVKSCLNQIVHLTPNMFEENLTLMLAISALLSIAATVKKAGSKAARITFMAGNTVYFVYLLLNRYLELVEGIGWLTLINGVYFIWVAVQIPVLFRGRKGLVARLLTTWISVVMVIAPLVVTSENAVRMCFPSSALLNLFALQLLGLVLEEANKRSLIVGLTAAMVVTVLLCGYFGKIYYDIGIAKRERVAYIQQEVEAGSGVILVPQYPHTEFIWRPNPLYDLRFYYFKEFYGIPQSTQLYF